MTHPLNISQFARRADVGQPSVVNWVASGYITATRLNPHNPTSEMIIAVPEVERALMLVKLAKVIGIHPGKVLGFAHALRTHDVSPDLVKALTQDMHTPDGPETDGHHSAAA